MTNSDYHYPDTGDHITQLFIDHEEPFEGYWKTSEERALGRVATKVNEALRSTSHVRALDVGCGDGRLLRWLAQFASRITALDPDRDRLEAARSQWELHEHNAEVHFEVAPVQQYIEGKYDLIICSHVIQHVATGAVDEILRALQQLAAPGCVLVLAYSRAPIGGTHFSIDYLHEGRARSKHVSRQQFDAAVRTGDLDGGLPIAHLDPAVLRNQLAQFGWIEHWNWTYHILDDLGVVDCIADRDVVVNDSSSLATHLGRDMLTLSRCGLT